MIAIKREGFSRMRAELGPLLEAHWKEVAHFQLEIPLDPLWEVYEKGEATGKMGSLSVRDDGQLVGYSYFFLSPHPHYRTVVVARSDVLYLTPVLRLGGVGGRLIEETETLAREMGAHVFTWHVKPEAHLDFGPYLERVGCLLHERVFARIL